MGAILKETGGGANQVRNAFVLQKVPPALMGLMDGSISTLAPLFATAGLTGRSMDAFFVGLAPSVRAGISMGLAEMLPDDGKVTHRGKSWPASSSASTGSKGASATATRVRASAWPWSRSSSACTAGRSGRPVPSGRERHLPWRSPRECSTCLEFVAVRR